MSVQASEVVETKPARSAPGRVLYIVARDRPELYTALREAFLESRRLGIVLDRREQPRATADPATERRRLAVDETLRSRGWARVRVEPDGRAMLIEDVTPVK
jgi:hypothetical protein